MTHSSPPAKDDAIVIVGAGIFGLSTALHLARRGYGNVTVFDKQPYEETLYSYFDGCDAASADINKIIRSAYGSQTEYQDLSIEALAAWNSWNDELRGSGDAVPPGMSSDDVVWMNCGTLSCGDWETLPSFEKATVENMEAAGYQGTQLITGNPEHERLAAAQGKSQMIQPFAKGTLGILDTTGGLSIADKACRFALHKAKMLGARFVLDPSAGKFTSFSRDATGKVNGIHTADGLAHSATLTIMACGGWTPTLLPSLDGLCEATAGSVAMLKIPAASPLRERFHPSRFPTWSFKMRDGAAGGLYGFPIDASGTLKIGYRGTKYTNPRPQDDGRQRSEPWTRWSEPEALEQLPKTAVEVIRGFLDEYLPELGREGISIWMTRICWYTDSFDNHFVVDRVPELDGVMVATGGSGHAFKYLPNIGDWVVDIVEGVGTERRAVKAWRWRKLEEGATPVNKLMEGSGGPRALQNVALESAGL